MHSEKWRDKTHAFIFHVSLTDRTRFSDEYTFYALQARDVQLFFSHAHKHKCLRLIVVEQRSSSNDSNRLIPEYCSHYVPTGDTSKQHTKLLLNTDIRSPENNFESKTARSYVPTGACDRFLASVPINLTIRTFQEVLRKKKETETKETKD